MDVIALHAAGITNAVATLGTAITSEQARVMSKYTKRVIISYDADEAGQKAAARALKLLEEVGLEVSVLKVPGAKDPDEYIKTFGVDKFKDVITNAKSKFEYNLDSVLSRYDINIPQDKITALQELEKMISQVYSVAERDVYIHTVAKKFGVEFNSVKADVERIINRNILLAKRGEGKKVRQETSGYSDRINPDFIKAPTVARSEEAVLGLLLLFDNHRAKVFKENLLSEEDFFTDLGKRIFSNLKKCFEENDHLLVSFSQSFDLDEMGRITKMKTARMSLTENGEQVLLDSISTLKTSLNSKATEKSNTIDSLNEILRLKRQDKN